MTGTTPAPEPDQMTETARPTSGRLVIAHLDPHQNDSPLRRALRAAGLTPNTDQENPGP